MMVAIVFVVFLLSTIRVDCQCKVRDSQMRGASSFDASSVGQYSTDMDVLLTLVEGLLDQVTWCAVHGFPGSAGPPADPNIGSFPNTLDYCDPNALQCFRSLGLVCCE